MTKILDTIHSFLWGAPVLLMIIGVGAFYSLSTDFLQLRMLPKAMRIFFRKLVRREQSTEGISSFQALCTALAATVGTGNLVGVAGAICIGGPGAVFWMWICGILGMITKYAEVILAVHYRIQSNDVYIGGPMYIITSGMTKRWHWLAKLYALLGVFAAFGVGNGTQINALVSGINNVIGFQTDRRNFAMGLILAVLVGAMLLGGASRIGAAAEIMVPYVSAMYILMCIGVLVCRAQEIPEALCSIVKGAFSPRSVTGGVIGSFSASLRTGCSRGVFTNEAGMGTASIAHASAQTTHPVEQGLMGIMEVFLDTIVICTLTALVILISGVPVSYGRDTGAQLTAQSFASVYGSFANLFLTGALCCFAFATVLGWGLYGARCSEFLFGSKAWKPFALCQMAVVIPGAMLNTQTIWLLAEIVNGLMTIPNLIALAALSPVVIRLTIEYERNSGMPNASGGYYADFHQRKPL